MLESKYVKLPKETSESISKSNPEIRSGSQLQVNQALRESRMN